MNTEQRCCIKDWTLLNELHFHSNLMYVQNGWFNNLSSYILSSLLCFCFSPVFILFWFCHHDGESVLFKITKVFRALCTFQNCFSSKQLLAIGKKVLQTCQVLLKMAFQLNWDTLTNILSKWKITRECNDFFLIH